MNYIADNAEDIRGRAEAAAVRAGRSMDDITVIGVTKTVSHEKVAAMRDAGIINAGENRVQELISKYPRIDGIKWHLIGHLQTNKVKQIIDKVVMIHSLDSIRLAEEINRRAAALDITMDVLIEVNIANEFTKFGVMPDDASKLAEQTLNFGNLRLKGLMCVAPFVENPQHNRYFFRKMKNLFIDINAKLIDNITMDCLSMGMTQDFEVAIEEGSNMIRVGTGIFGERRVIKG